MQADLSLNWTHMSFCWFCCALAQIINCLQKPPVTGQGYIITLYIIKDKEKNTEKNKTKQKNKKKKKKTKKKKQKKKTNKQNASSGMLIILATM